MADPKDQQLWHPALKLKCCATQVDRCWVVGANGSSVDLTPSLDGATSVVPTFAPTLMERAISTRATTSAPERRQRSVQVQPYYRELADESDASMLVERAISTRVTTSAAEQRQRSVQLPPI